MKVLVVDDDIMTLEAIKQCLKSPELDIILAQNSLQALDTLENSKNKLDLIICDIMMPGFSGLDLLSLLKNFYFTKIPVIIMSSLTKNDVVSSSKELGATDFIPKPINFDKLVDLVKKRIGWKST